MSNKSVDYASIVESFTLDKDETFFTKSSNKSVLISEITNQYDDIDTNSLRREVNSYFIRRSRNAISKSANHSSKNSDDEPESSLSKSASVKKPSRQTNSESKSTSAKKSPKQTNKETKPSQSKRKTSSKNKGELVDVINLNLDMNDNLNVISNDVEDNYFEDAEDVIKSLITAQEYKQFSSLLSKAMNEHDEVVSKHVKSLKREPKVSPKISYTKSNKKCKIGLKDVTEDCPNLKKLFELNESFKAKDMDDYEYLTSPIIRTHNIIDLTILKKVFDTEPNCKIIPNLNYFHSENEFTESDAKSNVDFFDTDYASLFIDIQNVKTKSLVPIVKKIYSHRNGIVNRINSDTSYKRLDLWNAATANLIQLKNEYSFNSTSVKIIDSWLNIMKSRFAYYVIMFGIKSNKIFDKHFNKLIGDELSIRLFSGPLYPISFAFTPFMLWGDGKLNGNVFNALQSIKYSNLKDLNWVYYLKHTNDEMNSMIGYCIKFIKPYDDSKIENKSSKGRGQSKSKVASKKNEDKNDDTNEDIDLNNNDDDVDDDVFDNDNGNENDDGYEMNEDDE